MRTAVQHEKGAHERIVDAARHLFSERGFHQTAIADLAQAADVSVGAIYRHFGGKADIIREIVATDSDRLRRALNALCEDVSSGRISLGGAIEEIVRRELAQDGNALLHEIMAEAHRNEEIASTISGYCGQYRVIFRELVRLGGTTLSDEELSGAEDLLLTCLFGLSHRELTAPRLDAATTVEIATRLILRALQVDISCVKAG